MKTTKILFWVTTTLFFLFEGVLPALTSNMEMAIEGIRHLGYPDYFRVLLTVFKVSGALVLILPMVKGRLKEWAYAGFTFNLISAAVSHWAVDGFSADLIFIAIVMGVLAVSYVTYHKLKTSNS